MIFARPHRESGAPATGSVPRVQQPFGFIDWLMELPEDLGEQFWREVHCARRSLENSQFKSALRPAVPIR